MRVAIVGIPADDIQSIQPHLKSLSKGFEAAGHMADLIDHRGDALLSSYDYIVVMSEPVGLGSKLPAGISQYLANTVAVLGKRSMAILRRKGFASSKALRKLMRCMEAEGMVVTSAEIVRSQEDSLSAAREAPVQRT